MKRVVLTIAAAAVVATAATAGASHPRPQGATPLRVALVPAYDECTVPNRYHGPPLAYPSCRPPVQSSSFLTVGTFDANGAAPSSVGHFSIAVSGPSFNNLVLSSNITDVRCKPATTGACGNANVAGGRDYVGELQVDATIRVTDHDNGVDPGGGTDAATWTDIPAPVGLVCANTADTSTGGVCKFTQGMCPTFGCTGFGNGERTVIGFTQIRVLDGGADGIMSTTPNNLFAVQGLFVP